jgi:serine/threonine-protein kinase
VKGRASFSEGEADKIRSILAEIRRAERTRQKELRDKLRSMGFFISDWSSNQSGFTASDFDDLIRNGWVLIEGSTETQHESREDASTVSGPIVPGYEILEPLGRGGMGEVFRAKDLERGSIVAVKVILPELARDPEFRRRFEKESEVAASVSDPHVVRVRDSGETADGILFLAMDLIDGTDLQSLIDAGGRLSAEKALPLLRDTAAGLDAIHAGGLVHRDMKPGNLLVKLGRPSQGFIADFGLARSIESATTLTSRGNFLGTLDYASPEQVSGKDLDARSDVYSLACVFFHALVGDPPFGHKETAAKLYAQAHENAPRVGGRGFEDLDLLEGVFERALEKDPRDRYPSAGDFAAAFESALRGEANTRKERFVGVGDAAPHNIQSETKVLPGERGSRTKWLAAVGSVILICLVAATAFLVLRDSGDGEANDVVGVDGVAVNEPGTGSAGSDTSGGSTPSPDLHGAPVAGQKASVVDRGGTKETTIASYATPSGDYYQSVFDRSGDTILSMAQFSFGDGIYKVCISDSSQNRQCESFPWSDSGQGLYTGEVNLLDNFDVVEPGTYRATWSVDAYGQVGKPLSFQMFNAMPGGVVGPGEASGYIAQLGSFKTEVEAQVYRSTLASQGFTSNILRSNQYEELEPGYWVVFSGPFSTQHEADDSAAASGTDGAFGRPID